MATGSTTKSYAARSDQAYVDEESWMFADELTAFSRSLLQRRDRRGRVMGRRTIRIASGALLAVGTIGHARPTCGHADDAGRR